jgi:hypothetical protein
MSQRSAHVLATKSLALLSLSVALALSGGCKGDPEESDTSNTGTTGGATSEGMSSTSVDATTTTTTSATTAAETTGTSADTCNFLDCGTTGDGGPPMCDIWAQDCPEGEKCMPYAKDGGGSWNATRCSPLAENPGLAGDPCTVDGSAVSGIDDCGLGLLCWFVDNETGEGTCLSMCEGSEASPSCPAMQLCDISNEGVLILCLDTCDPVLVDCAPGLICFPSSMGLFICDFDASGEEGAYGEPCEFINVCDPGLYCANPESVPGCNAGGCCSEFCDINGENTCSGQDMGQVCVPWYEDGMAPPGLEHVGGCSLP